MFQGVPKDTTSEETIKICLSEIDRCYEDNVAPFFLNLAGWVFTLSLKSLSKKFKPSENFADSVLRIYFCGDIFTIAIFEDFAGT